MKKNIFFQNKVVMHVLYFLLKKLMEPPFSEYLVLLNNRVTFSYSFINFFYLKLRFFLESFANKIRVLSGVTPQKNHIANFLGYKII
jgi:hypothetical protein